MLIDERFNKRTAPQVKVTPTVHAGPQYDNGLLITFFAGHNSDKGRLSLRMSPIEALELASELITSAGSEMHRLQVRSELLLARAVGQGGPADSKGQ